MRTVLLLAGIAFAVTIIGLAAASAILARRFVRLLAARIDRSVRDQFRAQHGRFDYAINVAINAQAELTSLILPQQLRGAVDAGLVCSMTTIPDRLSLVHLTIESVLLQSMRPRSVELYLSDRLSPADLPESLTRLQSLGLRVNFAPDVGPHTKLIYALRDFPADRIVTVDDDHYYPSNMIAALLRMSAAFPEAVVGNWARRLRLDEAGVVMGVRSGELLTPPLLLTSRDQDEHRPRPSLATLVYGSFGVLYPPGVLDPRVGDAEMFQRLCPTEDDIWFKAMALLKGTPAVPTNLGMVPGHHVLRGSQSSALRHVNHDNGRNATQMKAVFDHFDLHRLLRPAG